MEASESASFLHIEHSRAGEREDIRIARNVLAASQDMFNRFPDSVIETSGNGECLVLDSRFSAPDTFTVRYEPYERINRWQVIAAKRDELGRATSKCGVSLFVKQRDGELLHDPDFDFCAMKDTFDLDSVTHLDFTGETPSGTRPMTQAERLEQFFYPIIEGRPVPAARARLFVESDQRQGLFT